VPLLLVSPAGETQQHVPAVLLESFLSLNVLPSSTTSRNLAQRYTQGSVVDNDTLSVREIPAETESQVKDDDSLEKKTQLKDGQIPAEKKTQVKDDDSFEKKTQAKDDDNPLQNKPQVKNDKTETSQAKSSISQQQSTCIHKKNTMQLFF
jgi:hypothetical protein